MSALLSLAGVSVRFAGVKALAGVSMAVETGEILGLIGPNGAGKTTLINAVSGAVPSTGDIRLEGRPIRGMPPHRIARLGLARTFQIVQPFPDMSARDNVAAGALFAKAVPDLPAARRAADAVLDRGGRAAAADKPAAALTLAQRKRLEVAKGLAARPRMLLLDEVNAGLNASEIDAALALIRSVAADGIAVVIVEHLMKVVSGLCDRVVVLHHGAVIADGAPAAVLADPAVVEAYLGHGHGDAERARA